MTKKDIELRSIFKAIIITLEYDGVIPSYNSHGDEAVEVDKEIDNRVDEVMSIFKEIYDDELWLNKE